MLLRKGSISTFSNEPRQTNEVIRNSKEIRVQQYDKGIRIYFYIRKDSLLEPITGAEVLLKFMNNDKGIVLNRKCTITDSEMGECLYILTAEDTFNDGNYITEIEIRYSNGVILSVDNPFSYVVTPEIIPNN